MSGAAKGESGFGMSPPSWTDFRRELGAVNWSHPAYRSRCIVARNDEEIVSPSLQNSTEEKGHSVPFIRRMECLIITTERSKIMTLGGKEITCEDQDA